MDWLNLEQMLILSNHPSHSFHYPQKTTHPTGSQNETKVGPFKLGPRLRNVGKTRHTKYHFRAQAYDSWTKIPDEVKKIPKKTLQKVVKKNPN